MVPKYAKNQWCILLQLSSNNALLQLSSNNAGALREVIPLPGGG